MKDEVSRKLLGAVLAGRTTKSACVRAPEACSHGARLRDVRVKCAAAVALAVASRQCVKRADALPGALSDKALGETYRKWLTPENMGAAAVGLGGAYALKKLVGDGWWKYLLGAGALYGGYKLFQSPYMRDLVGRYGNKAVDYLSRQFRSMLPQKQFDMQQAQFDTNRLKWLSGDQQAGASAGYRAWQSGKPVQAPDPVAEAYRHYGVTPPSAAGGAGQ